MNLSRRSFLRSLLGAIAFSPVVCKLAERLEVKTGLDNWNVHDNQIVNCDSITQMFIRETERMHGELITKYLKQSTEFMKLL